jgi:tetratricopeptide (TPR) repeat protein
MKQSVIEQIGSKASLFNPASVGIQRASQLAFCLVFFAIAGCAGGWGATNQAVKRNTANDAGPSREDRKEALARDFDKQRDDAQLDAAASCWQRGDVDGCTKLIDQLLARNSNNRRALLLLADVDLFNGRPEDAATQLQTLVATDPKDAVAQHALAQVWDACGRHEEALAHYQIANQLDPQNEEFALSYKMATGLVDLPYRNSAYIATANRSGDVSNPQPQAMVGTPVKLASATSPVVAVPETNEKSDNINTSVAEMQPSHLQSGLQSSDLQHVGEPVTNSAAVIDQSQAEQASWRLNGSSLVQQKRPQIFVPPENVNNWLGRLDFVNPADNAPVTTNATPLSASALSVAEIVPALETVPPSPPRATSAAASLPVAPGAKPSIVASPVSYEAPAKTSISPVQPAFLAESSDHPEVLQDPLHLAAEALGRGDTEKAVDIASRGLSRTPDQAAELYRLLGTAHYRRGEYQAAQAALTQALSLDKADALSYFLMGATLDKLDEHEAAQKYFSEAAHLDARYAF